MQSQELKPEVSTYFGLFRYPPALLAQLRLGPGATTDTVRSCFGLSREGLLSIMSVAAGPGYIMIGLRPVARGCCANTMSEAVQQTSAYRTASGAHEA